MWHIVHIHLFIQPIKYGTFRNLTKHVKCFLDLLYLITHIVTAVTVMLDECTFSD